MIWLASAVALAACPATVRDVDDAVDQSLQAWGSLDEKGFVAHEQDAVERLGCTNEALLAADVAAFLRMRAIRAFYDSDEAVAREYFAAALTIEPHATLSTALAPAGSPLERLYTQAHSEVTTEHTMIPLPVGDTLWVDGVRSSFRPALPAIAQLFGPDGAMRWSGVLTPADAIPAAFAPPAVGVETPLPTKPVRPPNVLADVAIATGATSAVLWGLSVLFRVEYDHANSAGHVTRAQALTTDNHAAFFGFAGTGAAAVGLGVVALLPRHHPH